MFCTVVSKLFENLMCRKCKLKKRERCYVSGRDMYNNNWIIWGSCRGIRPEENPGGWVFLSQVLKRKSDATVEFTFPGGGGCLKQKKSSTGREWMS